MLLVGERSLIFGGTFFLVFVVMSVGVAVFFAGTSSIVTAVFVFNVYFR